MMMDSSYFTNYSRVRQLLQDTIIRKYLAIFNKKEGIKRPLQQLSSTAGCPNEVRVPSKNPWIFFTCGPFGAGKSHSIRFLHEHGVLDLEEYIYIDPDKIKFELPEAKEYIKKDPLNAGTLLHKESTFLSLMIQYITLDEGKAMIIDGSLKNFNWNHEHMLFIRRNYPLYNIGIIKVEADISKMLERAHKRAQITGRIISDKIIIETAKDIKESFPKYLGLVNFYLVVDNNTEPRIIKTRLINPSLY